MKITIDRISSRDFAIAEEKDDGHDILVFGAKNVGQQLDVYINTLGGTHVGLIKNPTEEQCRRAMEQMPKHVRIAQNHHAANHYRTEKTKEYDYGGKTAPGGVKKISDEEMAAAKDQSKSLKDIAEEIGQGVTETQSDSPQRETNEEKPESDIASEVSQRHD
jgi:hypothetical protein